MQPYFFPYLGYWQLLNAVDRFVILDDVNFIMRGYINRNSILLNGRAHRFSIPLQKPSQNKLICETKLAFSEKERAAFQKTIQMAYSHAPYYHDISLLLKQVLEFEDDDLTAFIKRSLTLTKDYLGISTPILLSSAIEKDHRLKAQDRILEINRQLGASIYMNPIGGQALYDRDTFSQAGIDLKFLKMGQIEYRQFGNSFVPNLSMIDVIMFNSKREIQKLLNEYQCV